MVEGLMESWKNWESLIVLRAEARCDEKRLSAVFVILEVRAAAFMFMFILFVVSRPPPPPCWCILLLLLIMLFMEGPPPLDLPLC